MAERRGGSGGSVCRPHFLKNSLQAFKLIDFKKKRKKFAPTSKSSAVAVFRSFFFPSHLQTAEAADLPLAVLLLGADLHSDSLFTPLTPRMQAGKKQNKKILKSYSRSRKKHKAGRDFSLLPQMAAFFLGCPSPRPSGVAGPPSFSVMPPPRLRLCAGSTGGCSL